MVRGYVIIATIFWGKLLGHTCAVLEETASPATSCCLTHPDLIRRLTAPRQINSGSKEKEFLGELIKWRDNAKTNGPGSAVI